LQRCAAGCASARTQIVSDPFDIAENNAMVRSDGMNRIIASRD
jgi:hypothetical protein